MPNLTDDSVRSEIYILIAHFLNNSSLNEVGKKLIEELERQQLIPTRIDWTGAQHQRQFSELSHNLNTIPHNFILQSFNQLRYLLDNNLNNNLSRTNTLLGTGQFSLLQDLEKKKQNLSPNTNQDAIPKDFYLKYRTNNKNNLNFASRFKNVGTNLILNLTKNQMIGSMKSSEVFQPELLKSINNHKRILGHLSAVYCVCFDRTGRYILTGADDNLIKVWCASGCRLLATLRGHEKEISDIDINFENTLVASGSCDKSIRIWNLKSTECTTVLQGHNAMVTSLEFSPMCRGSSRWLASSGNDGVICFWSWDSKTLVFNPKPKKFIEKSRPSGQILCISFSAGGSFLAAGSNDFAIRVYFFDNNDPIKICELESHGNLVDSIQYANNSARFLSGSKDGTARIWKYESQKWKTLVIDVSKTLKKQEQDDNTISLMDINKKHSVTMVTWNTDDTMVVTAQNNFLIKVWNSNNAALIHELKGHTDEVFVLEAHPKDPRLLLSSGHDGNVIIWNLLTGKLIKKFYNRIENEGHGCLFDTKWSPTCDMLASTDSHGYLTIFGFGNDDKYKRIPNELFFHTDYRPLMRDSNEFVVDEQTQQPPHLMQPPFLVNADGNPYDLEFQRLVPGREHLTDAQLNPHVITNERGMPEIIGENGEIEDENNQQTRPRGTAWVRDLVRPLNLVELSTNESKRLGMLNEEEDYFITEYRKELKAIEISKTGKHFDFKSKTSNFRRGRKSLKNNQDPINRLEVTIRNRLTTKALFDTDNEDEEITTQTRNNAHSEYDEETLDDQYIDIDDDSNTQHSIGAGVSSSSNHAIPTTSTTAAAASTSRSNHSNNNSNSNHRSNVANYYSQQDLDMPSENNSDSSEYSDWAEEDGRKTLKPPSRTRKPRTNTVSTTSRTTNSRRLRVLDDDDEDENTNNIDFDDATNHSFDSTPKTKKSAASSKKQKKIVSDDDDENSNTQFSVGASNHAVTSTTTANAQPTTSRSSNQNDHVQSRNHTTNSNHYYDDEDDDVASEHNDSSEYSDWAEEDGRKTLKPPSRTRKQRAARTTQSGRRTASLRAMVDDENANIDFDDATNHSIDSTPKITRKTTNSAKRMRKIMSDEEDGHLSDENGEDCEDDDEDEYEEIDDEDYSCSDNQDNQDSDRPCTSHTAYSRTRAVKRKKRKIKPRLGTNVTKSTSSSKITRTNSNHTFSNRFSSKLNESNASTSSINNNANKSVSFTKSKRGKSLKPLINYSECPIEYRPPEWLTSTKPKKSPYVPQIGDEVVYFRQGHELYAKAVKNFQAYDLDEQSLPWHTHKLNVEEHCRVMGLKVENRPPRLVCLKLGVIDQNTGKVTNTKFSIKFHDMAHVVDFVILRQFYDRAIEKDWRAKDRFRCIIDDVWWTGVIEAKKPFQDEHSDSYFQCLQTTWDNGENEQLSPWDLEPLCGVNTRKSKTATSATANSAEGSPVTAEELKSLLYVPEEDEWPAEGRDAECERILKGLQKIMELSIAEHFNYPVDLDAYPDYAVLIEYPIDLNTIRERLENRYYRRINSIQWDVRKIETNANKYNERNSDIVRKAALLCELLLEFIGDPHCSNPTPIYKRLCQNKNLPIGEEANTSAAASTSALIETPDSQYFNLRRKARNNHKTYKDDNDLEDQEASDDNDNDYLQKPSYSSRQTARKSSQHHFSKKSSQSSNSKYDLKSKRKKTSWQENGKKLVNDMINHPDAVPFTSPVDLTEYPDYLKVIDTPMDLNTIKRKLLNSSYGNNLDKFDSDCKLLFHNSKAYNTNKRSKIYGMTLRLQSYYDNRITEIFRDNQSSLEHDSQIKYEKRKTRQMERHSNSRSHNEPTTSNATSNFNPKKPKLQNLNNSDLFDDQLNASSFNGISTRSSTIKKSKSSTGDNFQQIIKNEHQTHSQSESHSASASSSGATSSKYLNNSEFMDENSLERSRERTRERARERSRERSRESILRNIVPNRLTVSKRSISTKS